MFFADCDDDHERINFRQFMKVLATFRSSSKPSTRPRQASRQESIQNILSSLSQNRFRHSRHSSCDGFFNYYPVQHHTTNQHSIHYVASTVHLTQNSPSAYGGQYNQFNYVGGISSGNPQSGGGGIQFRKPSTVSLVDSDEPANSRKQKLHFMFKIYDVDNDNRISLDDLTQVIKTMVGSYVSESKLAHLAAKTMRQADRNGDGYIDFDEFCTAFLHRDIDKSLRVRFATQTSDRNNKNDNEGQPPTSKTVTLPKLKCENISSQ